MTDGDKALEAIRELGLLMTRRVEYLGARCDALTMILGAVAEKAGIDRKALRQAYERAEAQCHAERLLRAESTSPSLAAALDTRDQHGEDLLQNRKILEFLDPESGSKDHSS